MKILIVDDNPIDIAIIKKELTTSLLCHYNIDVAHSVKMGLTIAENKKFDVILLDYQMPEVDGIEMIIEMRAKPELGDTAIVVISASQESTIALNCIEAGAQDFIPKNQITEVKLNQAIIHSRKRFEMEQKMFASYLNVKNMSERDFLTGIHNRNYFDENLKLIITNHKKSELSVGMLILDLDNFKHINDSMGHEAGDILLKEVVSRIKLCLRDNDGFARLGGDEFVITLHAISSLNEIRIVADRVLNSFNKQFTLNNKKINCGVSIGAALYPNDAKNSEALLKCADIAMYRAKQQGKNTICFYKSHYQNEFNRHFSIQNEMIKILAESSFRLAYQAVYCTHTQNILGFEALIRWPEQAIPYTPDQFIPIAEETRLINKIGPWVISNAIEQLSLWQQKYAKNLTMAINISPIQLQDPHLSDLLMAKAQKYHVKPNTITLEITETAFLEHKDKTLLNLETLTAKGFKIALDDFGMGYSSISHLNNFTIDVVKLDKSIQPKDASDNKSIILFEALSTMLKKLGFIVVAEGIETEYQLSLCKQLNINTVQGYLLSMPESAQMNDEKLSSKISKAKIFET